MKIISTHKLLDIILNNPRKIIEARLIIKHFIMATHFIYFNGNNIVDEGIDGERQLVCKRYYFENYNSNCWIIDNIV